MSNTLAPFGFQSIGTASGKPNFADESNPPFRISATWTTPIYYGDAVRMWVSGDGATASAGYIVTWIAADGSAATKILTGIFVGCNYFSTSQNRPVNSRYWPGADATGDVNAFVVTDPNRLWKVQAGGASAITQTSIGQTVDILATPVGSTVTGQSGMKLDAPTTSAALPFKVVNVITAPQGANGTDLTTPFNYVVVAFNNQQNKALLGV